MFDGMAYEILRDLKKSDYAKENFKRGKEKLIEILEKAGPKNSGRVLLKSNSPIQSYFRSEMDGDVFYLEGHEIRSQGKSFSNYNSKVSGKTEGFLAFEKFADMLTPKQMEAVLEELIKLGY